GRTVGSDDSDLEDEVRTQNGDQQSVERSSTESAGERRIEEQQEAIIEEQIAELRARDQEVRAHEQAHKAVGGQYAGAASFTYQSGPDGNRYAVGGEVSIDISPIPNDPQATISKMNTVKAAANAPAEPS
ncbi:putative metalloprotease CJM1_0395 family protein, partial [Oleiphilus sp. HI0123]